MKSFASILPFAGLALAQGQCGPQTVTETQVQKITVTVPAASAVAESSKTASRAPHKPHFSHYPFGNSTSNHTSSYPTNLSGRPTTLATQTSVLNVPSSSVSADAVTLIVSPSPVEAPSSSANAAIPTSETSATAAAASTVASVAAPAASTSRAVSTSAGSVAGDATYYPGLIDGQCSFGAYTLPAGLFGTAIGSASADSWDPSYCGQCVSVTGPDGKSIKAMITDQCVGCGTTHLDLFQNAFEQLAAVGTGIIDVDFSFVPCEITSPIVLRNKGGTSAYWFSMQVVNSNVAVTKLEVSVDGGATWARTEREAYNYWVEASGFGKDTVDVRVTSVGGNTITVKDVSVASGSSTTAASNFAA